MTYDLRRLRLHGLIKRTRTRTPRALTPAGTRVAVFYRKVHDRVLRPLVDGVRSPLAPLKLRRAIATIDRTINDHFTNARIGAA